MTRFYGAVGYGSSVESAPGVWEEVVTEEFYFGDVIRDSRRLSDGEYLHKDLTVGNSISILADAYAYEHFYAMRYVAWSGTLWAVQDVEVKAPRLILRLGGVYNGPTPPASDSP